MTTEISERCPIGDLVSRPDAMAYAIKIRDWPEHEVGACPIPVLPDTELSRKDSELASEKAFQCANRRMAGRCALYSELVQNQVAQ